MNEECMYAMMIEERAGGPNLHAGVELKESRRRKNPFQVLELSFEHVRSIGTERPINRAVK